MQKLVQEKRVSLHRCPSYDRASVAAAIAAIADDLAGGWKKIIPAGARVLLKPNLLRPATPEQVVCPHPELIRAVAQSCIDAGAARVRIGDSPGIGTARRVAEKSGIAQVAREMGIELIEFHDTATVSTPEGFIHRQFTIAAEVLHSDIIINIAKCKTHAIMGLTLAVKNLYGVLVGKQKARWHFQCGRNHRFFARLLVELAYTVSPALSIVDAVVCMEGNGPGNGTPRPLGFIAASRDMLSLDRIVADIVGFSPQTMPTLSAARDMGFDIAAEHIQVLGDRIEDITGRHLRPASHMHVEGPLPIRILAALLRHWMTTRPAVDPGQCRGCGMCTQACPARCISLSQRGATPVFDEQRCIRCFCCQEICPEGAITAHEPAGVRLLKHLRLE